MMIPPLFWGEPHDQVICGLALVSLCLYLSEKMGGLLTGTKKSGEKSEKMPHFVAF
jgi:hypothetical protein